MKFLIFIALFALISFENSKAQNLDDGIKEFEDLFRRGVDLLGKLSGTPEKIESYNVTSAIDSNDSNFKSFCNCRLNTNSRIVNGKIVTQNVPWMVSLALRSRGHFCGVSSLLNGLY